MGSQEAGGRTVLLGAATVALVVSALSLVQSFGYWALSAANDEPSRMMFVDHDGPAVTSALIGIGTLVLGVALLRGARRPMPAS
jgi:hypothetical protein